ncbi:RISC-loading complex subunit tarbp2 [Dermatophagoides pteronyssinus]|uniref:RISC-loading complex subunit tarbp2 n=1 Tax=Dermatophagoides pteronyssinus TaxID=6956 RepID=A0ABQ8J4D2_DERPT|nr:RISC-loading complex subunit tarbp2 [Dermatophagoides pteronyssinus]
MDTPISLLHVICIHNNTKADYTLLSREGQVHLPTFTFRVQVNQHLEEASGQSKKKAKHLAAKKMILKLFNDPNIVIKEDRNQIIESLKDVDESLDIIENKHNIDLLNQQLTGLSINGDQQQQQQNHQNQNHQERNNKQQQGQLPGNNAASAAAAVWSELENPIGKLQEICMKKHWHPPIYEEVQSSGLPHERLFTFQCRIENMNLVICGVGKSKKSAKREAAEKMLTVLRDEHLDKVDEILDRIPKNTSLNKNDQNNDNGGSTFNLRNEIIAFQENREQNRQLQSNHYLFFKKIHQNEKIFNEIQQLIPEEEDIENFIQKYLCDNYIIENIDNLIQKMAKIIHCQTNCILHPEKSQLNQYQYWAELIAIIDTSSISNHHNHNHHQIPILSCWGTDDDLQRAKQKALTRLFLTFIWYCY